MPEVRKKIKKYSIEEILYFYLLKTSGVNPSRNIILEGQQVRLNNKKLSTFVKSLNCVACGLNGAHFWLESNHLNAGFLSLYGFNEHGTEIELTVDHIIPKAKGGTDNHINLQTLCFKCNTHKGSQLICTKDIPFYILCKSISSIEISWPDEDFIQLANVS